MTKRMRRRARFTVCARELLLGDFRIGVIAIACGTCCWRSRARKVGHRHRHGVTELNDLTNLQELGLNGTLVTDAGVKDLKGLVSLQRLFLSGTKVTNAGLKELKGLKNLKALDLVETKVTDAGVNELKAALPKLVVTLKKPQRPRRSPPCRDRSRRRGAATCSGSHAAPAGPSDAQSPSTWSNHVRHPPASPSADGFPHPDPLPEGEGDQGSAATAGYSNFGRSAGGFVAG